MLESNIKSPGVYINEQNFFPNSVVVVPTAVPAFIGYTPQTSYAGKSYINVAQKITSFSEFQAIYCYPYPAQPGSRSKQYGPQYYLVQQKSKPAGKNYLVINDNYYAVLPDPNTIYYLYNSIRLFYLNGGGDAYIVSVGTYGSPSGSPILPDQQIVNPNVLLNDLKNGLAILKNEQEPTMYICPEATLLSVNDNAALMQTMLLQSQDMQTAICIFDIIGGKAPDQDLYMNDITTFRNNTGQQGLSYGTAYYPFIGTTIMQSQDIDYTNLFGGDLKQLEPLINPAAHPDPIVARILSNIQNSSGTSSTVTKYDGQLIYVSKVYDMIIKHVLSDANILPPSGAMAGVMTRTDNDGVWNSPANTSIDGAVSLPVNLSANLQDNLRIDAVSGKSVNPICSFVGRGIVVWGATTLDGNSADWKYISVRRTLIMLEQSCKLAAQAYVFQPNDKNTWEAVTAMITNVLRTIWSAGGLQGASPADAFSVECGLGSTMTAQDILNGLMNVTVKVAIVHPAEFIVLTFQQEMVVSG